MCTSTSMPKVTPVEAPPMQQEEKAPDMASRRKANKDSPLAGGTLLTGPSGAAPAATAGTTLLGG